MIDNIAMQILDTTSLPLAWLDKSHFEVLDKAFRKIRTSKLAQETLAQVANGRPLRRVYEKYYNHYKRDDFNDSDSSEKAKHMVGAFLEDYRIGSVEVEAQRLQKLQECIIGTREHWIRSMETVALVWHDLASSLYIHAEGGLRPLPAYKEPPLPPFIDSFGRVRELSPDETEPEPTELYHVKYKDHRAYPRGVADVVAYFAEYCVFGGVVLLDRGDSGLEAIDAYIEPSGHYGERMIYKLSEAQIARWSARMLSNDPSNTSKAVLPFKGGKRAELVGDYDVLPRNIYRERYAAKRPEDKPRGRCISSMQEHPTIKAALDRLVHGPDYQSESDSGS